MPDQDHLSARVHSHRVKCWQVLSLYILCICEYIMQQLSLELVVKVKNNKNENFEVKITFEEKIKFKYNEVGWKYDTLRCGHERK